MSLRAKAFISVLALVVAVTGGTVVYVSRVYEDAERERIAGDLDDQARRILERLATARQLTVAKIEPLLTDAATISLLKDVPEIKAGFQPIAKAWNEKIDADVTIVALDAFVAQDRRADVLGRTKNLAFCALHSRRDLGERERKDLLANAALHAVAEKSLPKSHVAMIASGGSVYYVVASPISEDLQEHVPVGVALLLVRLDDAWIAGTTKRAEVEQIVFAGDAISGKSMAREDFARAALDASRRGDAFELSFGGERHIGLRRSFDAESGGPGFLALMSLDRALAPLRHLQRSVLVAGAVLAVLGVLAALGASLLHIRRIERLRSATVRVREGDFETRVEVRGRDELAALTHDFNRMVTGLRALGIYTDPALARRVLEDEENLRAAGRRETGSIFFCDIADFTPIAERLRAEDLVAQLNALFGRLGRCIQEESGYLDKFIGDAVMAWWGPPFLDGVDAPARACRTALAALRASDELNRAWSAEGKPALRLRIGVASGECVVGNIGSETKKNFTVIGDPVNLASRLEGVNKLYGTRLLVDEDTAARGGAGRLLREVDQIRVKGRSRPVRVFELLGVAGDAAMVARAERYARALEAYRGRRFAEATAALATADAEDGAAAWLRARCAALAADPPSDGWEPVTTAEAK